MTQKDMDKVGDFFDEITSIMKTKEFNKETSAVLLLGADSDHECATYQGVTKGLVALIISAMEKDSKLEQVILKAVEIFIERRIKERRQSHDDGESA